MTNALRITIAALNNSLDIATVTDAQRIAFANEMAKNLVPNNSEPQSKGWKKMIDTRREIVNMLAGTCLRPVRNARTGETVMESVDTPWSCSVASEAYWCN
jgi:hypothetical protein